MIGWLVGFLFLLACFAWGMRRGKKQSLERLGLGPDAPRMLQDAARNQGLVAAFLGDVEFANALGVPTQGRAVAFAAFVAEAIERFKADPGRLLRGNGMLRLRFGDGRTLVFVETRRGLIWTWDAAKREGVLRFIGPNGVDARLVVDADSARVAGSEHPALRALRAKAEGEGLDMDAALVELCSIPFFVSIDADPGLPKFPEALQRLSDIAKSLGLVELGPPLWNESGEPAIPQAQLELYNARVYALATGPTTAAHLG